MFVLNYLHYYVQFKQSSGQKTVSTLTSYFNLQLLVSNKQE